MFSPHTKSVAKVYIQNQLNLTTTIHFHLRSILSTKHKLPSLETSHHPIFTWWDLSEWDTGKWSYAQPIRWCFSVFSPAAGISWCSFLESLANSVGSSPAHLLGVGLSPWQRTPRASGEGSCDPCERQMLLGCSPLSLLPALETPFWAWRCEPEQQQTMLISRKL